MIRTDKNHRHFENDEKRVIKVKNDENKKMMNEVMKKETENLKMMKQMMKNLKLNKNQ